MKIPFFESEPEGKDREKEPEQAPDLRGILTDHIELILREREVQPIPDTDVLTKNGGARWGLDNRVWESVNELHDRMRRTIYRVARYLEAPTSKPLVEALEVSQASMVEKRNASQLLDADRKVRVSCLALKLTIEAFADINQWIVERIESEGSQLEPGEERRLAFANAVLVYEVADFCLRTIDQFEFEGMGDLEKLHARQKKELARLRKESKTLQTQARSRGISEELRQRVEQDIANRESAITEIESSWENYMNGFQGIDHQLELIQKHLPSLRLVRDNARAQINVLSAVGVLQLAQNNVQALGDAAALANNLELAPLTAERVRSLLRV
jgi:hypothetical protein